jgi:hypothetical protein
MREAGAGHLVGGTSRKEASGYEESSSDRDVPKRFSLTDIRLCSHDRQREELVPEPVSNS